MLVRIAVRLGVRGELQALKVLIIVNVFLQVNMGFLEIKYGLMIEGGLSDCMLVLLEIARMVWSVVKFCLLIFGFFFVFEVFVYFLISRDFCQFFLLFFV